MTASADIVEKVVKELGGSIIKPGFRGGMLCYFDGVKIVLARAPFKESELDVRREAKGLLEFAARTAERKKTTTGEQQP